MGALVGCIAADQSTSCGAVCAVSSWRHSYESRRESPAEKHQAATSPACQGSRVLRVCVAPPTPPESTDPDDTSRYPVRSGSMVLRLEADELADGLAPKGGMRWRWR